VQLFHFANKSRILFAMSSAVAFLSLTSVMYYMYGMEFLHETYLYHLTRKDFRHNFSVYFYYLYITSITPSTDQSVWFHSIAPFLAFLPQLILLACFTIRYSRGQLYLPLCLFLQTLTFVTLNKVCTVQYFAWYFSILPIVMSLSSWPSSFWMLLLICSWLCSQMVWLYYAYLLEFLGLNMFVNVWFAGIAFFGANVFLLIFFVLQYQTPNNKVLH